MRGVAISAVVLVCAVTLATGCRDSDQRMDAGDGEKRLTVEDLRPLVTVSPENELRGVTIPLHPGAARRGH